MLINEFWGRVIVPVDPIGRFVGLEICGIGIFGRAGTLGRSDKIGRSTAFDTCGRLSTLDRTGTFGKLGRFGATETTINLPGILVDRIALPFGANWVPRSAVLGSP